MTNRIGRSTVLGVLFLAALLISAPARAQVIIKVNPDVFFRFGGQVQFWWDELQDATTKGYAQNLYIRRARVLITGQFAPDVSFFIQTDNPNVGKAPKSLTTGFLLQDAWVEWKIRNEFALDAGEMLIPLSREELNSTLSFLTIDISPTSTVFAGPTQTNATRDTGVQAKGYLADGRLEYRAGIFQGVRLAGSRNAFRRAAYLQYDFFDKEVGYVYAGTNLGKRKIVALSGGYDGQSKYKAYSGSLFANIPVNGGDEFAGLGQYNHYDGGTFLTAIPSQRDDLLEIGYYAHAIKLQPFVKWEDQKFAAASNPSKDVTRYAAGVNYYVHGQNTKFTGQFTHVSPRNHAINSTNEFTVQLQFWYY